MSKARQSLKKRIRQETDKAKRDRLIERTFAPTYASRRDRPWETERASGGSP